MASFGLDLDSPLLPNVDTYINPTKDEDEHRSALNAVVREALHSQEYQNEVCSIACTISYSCVMELVVLLTCASKHCAQARRCYMRVVGFDRSCNCTHAPYCLYSSY